MLHRFVLHLIQLLHKNAEELYRKATETQQAETWNKLAEYLYTARKNLHYCVLQPNMPKSWVQKNRDSIEWGKL